MRAVPQGQEFYGAPRELIMVALQELAGPQVPSKTRIAGSRATRLCTRYRRGTARIFRVHDSSSKLANMLGSSFSQSSFCSCSVALRVYNVV